MTIDWNTPLASEPQVVALTLDRQVHLRGGERLTLPTLRVLLEAVVTRAGANAIEANLRWTHPTVDGVAGLRATTVFHHDTMIALPTIFAKPGRIRAVIPRAAGMDAATFTSVDDPDSPLEHPEEVRDLLAHLSRAIEDSSSGAPSRVSWTRESTVEGIAEIESRTELTVGGLTAHGWSLTTSTTRVATTPDGQKFTTVASATMELDPTRLLAVRGELRLNKGLASSAHPSPIAALEESFRIDATTEVITADAMRSPHEAEPRPWEDDDEEEEMEEEASLAATIAGFTRSFSKRRGIDWNYDDRDIALVKAPVAEVSRFLERRGFHRTADAVGKTVRVGKSVVAVFRLAGHDWSAIVDESSISKHVAELSRELAAPVLCLVAWEGDFEYRYLEDGEIVEHLEATSDAIEAFQSRRRARIDLGDRLPGAIADALFASQGAYAPETQISYFFSDGRSGSSLEPGTRRQVNNPGFFLDLGGGREVHAALELESLDILVRDD